MRRSEHVAATDWDAAFAQHASNLHHKPLVPVFQEASLNYDASLPLPQSTSPSAATDSSFSTPLVATPSAPSSTISYDSDTESPSPTSKYALELYHLGVQLQISEREPLAIAALVEAVSLDATMGEAHLALAMSYGNERRRDESYSSLKCWVECLAGGRYREYLASWRNVMTERERDEGLEGRHDVLMEVMMGLAAHGARNYVVSIDPEVQIGLGLLFTLKADFAKAEDCFGAALGQLPDVSSSITGLTACS